MIYDVTKLSSVCYVCSVLPGELWQSDLFSAGYLQAGQVCHDALQQRGINTTLSSA